MDNFTLIVADMLGKEITFDYKDLVRYERDGEHTILILRNRIPDESETRQMTALSIEGLERLIADGKAAK
ncbi:hypothetical protein [Mucilaginibacter boryungensis]|uniref:Uncharacterized protein n=1 Tax=Mucilaginibacter boryungensis TaxID=768480 RepID=A0ABR9XGG5_9SPHI|nr:hypothetical protein [Mucilaginibacter boryungensis]MBE9666483.1 hypothetical protein [Mucilaginibacter boryungensis]